MSRPPRNGPDGPDRPDAPRPATERVERAYDGLDVWPFGRTLATLVDANRRAVDAVGDALPALERAAEGIAGRLAAGGRLVYAGAGTSGRLALQDAAELPPTFGFERTEVLLAGGRDAGERAAEGAEDDRAAARAAVASAEVGPDDALIGIAASGRTPYTLEAVAAARERGAFTVGLANAPGAPLLAAAEVGVLLDSGPEVLAGSTRLAAGTAQKVALNALSTAVLVRLGGAYRNLMVGMRPANAKLVGRAVAIVREATGADDAAARAALEACAWRLRDAIVILETGLDPAAARALLEASGERVRDALDAAPGPTPTPPPPTPTAEDDPP